MVRPDVVSVCAPARLHLGFLDLNGGLGRRFGGIGLSVSDLATRLSVERAGTTRVDGPEAERAAAHLTRLTDLLDLPRGHRLTIEEAIPAHSGLGSGTQLALAVAAALCALHERPFDPHEMAARLGRGSRSGLGAGLFATGGIVVDGGKGASEATPPMIARLSFPAAWRVIIVRDPAHRGLSGAAEIEAFRALPTFPASEAAEICRLTLMQVLPALAEEDLPAFGCAIAEIQLKVGSHFAPAQGGVFTSTRVGAAMRALSAAGTHGIGQSSWGSAGFAFAASQDEAEAAVAALARTGLCERLEIAIVEGLNHGARVEANG